MNDYCNQFVTMETAMLRITSLCILISGILINVCSQSDSLGSDRNIAVNPLTPSGITEAEAASLTDLLQTHLSNSDEFEVMERSEVDKVLKEQGFQQAGLCSETSCAMQMGQLLGVRYIVIGNVGLVGRTYTVNARLTDVATGRIVRNVTELHKGSIDGLVTDVMPVVARKLAGKKVEKKKGGISPAAIIAGAAGVAAIPAVVFFMRSRDSEKEQNSSSEVTIQWGE